MERKQTDYFRFNLLSVLGIVLFFVPVIGGSAPIVWASAQFKVLLGQWVTLLPVLSCLSLAIFAILGKGLKMEPFRHYLEREGPVKVGFFFSTALLRMSERYMSTGQAMISAQLSMTHLRSRLKAAS